MFRSICSSAASSWTVLMDQNIDKSIPLIKKQVSSEYIMANIRSETLQRTFLRLYKEGALKLIPVEHYKEQH